MEQSSLAYPRGAYPRPTVPPANDTEFNTGCMAYFKTSASFDSKVITPLRTPTVRPKNATTVEKSK
jgi:hypothetical protein